MPVYCPSSRHLPEVTGLFPVFRRTSCLEYLEVQAIIIGAQEQQIVPSVFMALGKLYQVSPCGTEL